MYTCIFICSVAQYIALWLECRLECTRVGVIFCQVMLQR